MTTPYFSHYPAPGNYHSTVSMSLITLDTSCKWTWVSCCNFLPCHDNQYLIRTRYGAVSSSSCSGYDVCSTVFLDSCVFLNYRQCKTKSKIYTLTAEFWMWFWFCHLDPFMWDLEAEVTQRQRSWCFWQAKIWRRRFFCNGIAMSSHLLHGCWKATVIVLVATGIRAPASRWQVCCGQEAVGAVGPGASWSWVAPWQTALDRPSSRSPSWSISSLIVVEDCRFPGRPVELLSSRNLS